MNKKLHKHVCLIFGAEKLGEERVIYFLQENPTLQPFENKTKIYQNKLEDSGLVVDM